MPEPVYRYRAEVLDVHDGDTYKVRVDLGFRCAVTIQLRLRGVDTPELPTPEGLRARDAAVALLLRGMTPGVVVESYKDRRSFERWVCDVWLSDGRSLASVLVDAGFGVMVP